MVLWDFSSWLFVPTATDTVRPQSAPNNQRTMTLNSVMSSQKSAGGVAGNKIAAHPRDIWTPHEDPINIRWLQQNWTKIFAPLKIVIKLTVKPEIISRIFWFSDWPQFPKLNCCISMTFLLFQKKAIKPPFITKHLDYYHCISPAPPHPPARPSAVRLLCTLISQSNYKVPIPATSSAEAQLSWLLIKRERTLDNKIIPLLRPF